MVRRMFAAFAAFLLFSTLGTVSASATTKTTVQKAVTWLKTQQQADGGFEVAGSPGFETPDAAIALAQAAQKTITWNVCAAYDAVVTTTDSGKSALSYLDDLVDDQAQPTTAANFAEVALIANALGLDPTHFDPDNDGDTNLIKKYNASKNADGSYGPTGSFNTTLLVVLANKSLGKPTSAKTKNLIKNSQQANGGWNYAGTSTDSLVDIDTTGRALEALAAMGTAKSDVHAKAGIAFLATHQQGDGGFMGDFQSESNASSTSLANFGLRSFGINIANSTWRDRAIPALVGTPYTSPDVFIQNRQQPDGHMESEYDSFGVNTVTTTQSVEALKHVYIPGITKVSPQAC